MSSKVENIPSVQSSLKKMTAFLIAGYIAFAVFFYFLSGEQLIFRDSIGNTQMPVADSCTQELTRNVIVEQVFTTDIQRLERISVQWTTFYRQNTGSVNMELYNDNTGQLVMRDSFDVSELSEGSILSIESSEPLEDSYRVPFRLRIYSNDSKTGSSPALLINTKASGNLLTFNGEKIGGELCFSAYGTDYIWTGVHYWKIVCVGFVILCLILWLVWVRFKKNKKNYVVNVIVAFQKYRFLIRQLLNRDFKTKYKRSVLGVFWSFLNPILTMVVQYFVFSTIFSTDIENYPSYLLIGVVAFNFFSESCNLALMSIVGNSSLITKVYMPKYIYPVTRVLSSMVNLGISIIPLVIVCIFTGLQFKPSALLALFFFACLIVFCMGIGLMLSTAMVFFRDTQFLWGIFSMLWMYATPIFYPESILPDNFKPLLVFNPLYHFIGNIRICLLDGISPEPRSYFLCLMISLFVLLVGALIFRWKQDKFVLYL